jgi:hypothetical protein
MCAGFTRFRRVILVKIARYQRRGNSRYRNLLRILPVAFQLPPQQKNSNQRQRSGNILPTNAKRIKPAVPVAQAQRKKS